MTIQNPLLCIFAGPVVEKALAEQVVLYSTASILQASTRHIRVYISKRRVLLGNSLRRGDEEKSRLMGWSTMSYGLLYCSIWLWCHCGIRVQEHRRIRDHSTFHREGASEMF